MSCGAAFEEDSPETWTEAEMETLVRFGRDLESIATFIKAEGIKLNPVTLNAIECDIRAAVVRAGKAGLRPSKCRGLLQASLNGSLFALEGCVSGTMSIEQWWEHFRADPRRWSPETSRRIGGAA